ncbi:Maf family protein [Tepidiforma flava]|uniref:dTTP/UTP pyrophosphatase n=1 Tax=Tepidiforma flava TaxID=3004094 RepID=A0ABY7M7E6_9CHLR|nr:Maf family protein [Tepidiforma flava]WBL35553.1 Maf family protein [Tepidiforma flava]
MSRPVVLASASPRRRELLAALLDDFGIDAADIAEDLEGDAVDCARQLAYAKAEAVARRYPAALVIGCDTVVFRGLRLYAKPADTAEAAAMLRELRGRPHQVVTAVAVIAPEGAAIDHEISTVVMADLPDAVLEAYAASGRTLDKAGGYAIQHEDVRPVARLEGCYCGVMGLPLWTLYRLLELFGCAPRPPDRAFERCAACPARPRSP